MVFHNLATLIKSGSNALANQNATLDRSQTRFVRMLEHEFKFRFEICILIGQHITSAFLTCVARSWKTTVKAEDNQPEKNMTDFNALITEMNSTDRLSTTIRVHRKGKRVSNSIKAVY